MIPTPSCFAQVYLWPICCVIEELDWWLMLSGMALGAICHQSAQTPGLGLGTFYNRPQHAVFIFFHIKIKVLCSVVAIPFQNGFWNVSFHTARANSLLCSRRHSVPIVSCPVEPVPGMFPRVLRQGHLEEMHATVRNHISSIFITRYVWFTGLLERWRPFSSCGHFFYL